MIGKRNRTAKLIAARRFKKWYPDMNIKNEAARLGSLKKTNCICSGHCCCNPRHSNFYSGKEQLHINERKAPVLSDWGLK